MLQAGRSWIRVPIYLIFPVALDPRVHLASNINEYQKKENNVSLE
jgi:hypothetical protein